MKEYLNKLQELYENGQNIISYLKEDKGSEFNTSEIIQASYDLQAGTYRKKYYEDKEPQTKYCKALAKSIAKLGDINSILLVGCGELITLSLLMKYLQKKPKNVYGIDISFSRLKYGQTFAQEQATKKIKVFVSDLYDLPFADDSIDLVLSNHSLEPNGGREKVALSELYRVSRKYIFMNEPSYKYGDKIARQRINKYGYVKNLSKHARDLGFNVVRDELFEFSINPKNPTGTTIIQKDDIKSSENENPIACPVTKKPIKLVRGSYYCKESKLVYPIIDGIPVLTRSSGIIAFHYE